MYREMGDTFGVAGGARDGMPWVEQTTVSQRAEVVALSTSEAAGVSTVARRYGVSRKTVYKWQARHAAGESLEDRSHRPHTSPARTGPAMEQRVVALRQRHPYWGSRKLHRLLVNDGIVEVPSPSTITRVLARHGLLNRDPASSPAMGRFEAAGPNHLWQMDFKGPLRLSGGPGSILSVLDDHSRFLVALHACPDQRTTSVQEALTPVFRRYGLPYRILCDNGPPWGAGMEHGYTALTVWLLRLGIDVGHGRPYHPQTQGKVERFHGTLEAELLRHDPFTAPGGPQPVLDRYRAVYNTERPHLALDLATPVERYLPSPRPFPETLPPVEYGPDVLVRRVQAGGWFSLYNRQFHVSKALQGQPVALRPTLAADDYAVFFCHKQVATITLSEREK